MEYHGHLFTEEEARKWSKERIQEEIAEMRERVESIRKTIEDMERKNEEEPYIEEYQDRTKKIIRYEGYIDDYEYAIAFLKSLL